MFCFTPIVFIPSYTHQICSLLRPSDLFPLTPVGCVPLHPSDLFPLTPIGFVPLTPIGFVPCYTHRVCPLLCPFLLEPYFIPHQKNHISFHAGGTTFHSTPEEPHFIPHRRNHTSFHTRGTTFHSRLKHSWPYFLSFMLANTHISYLCCDRKPSMAPLRSRRLDAAVPLLHSHTVRPSAGVCWTLSSFPWSY